MEMVSTHAKASQPCLLFLKYAEDCTVGTYSSLPPLHGPKASADHISGKQKTQHHTQHGTSLGSVQQQAHGRAQGRYQGCHGNSSRRSMGDHCPAHLQHSLVYSSRQNAGPKGAAWHSTCFCIAAGTPHCHKIAVATTPSTGTAGGAAWHSTRLCTAADIQYCQGVQPTPPFSNSSKRSIAQDAHLLTGLLCHAVPAAGAVNRLVVPGTACHSTHS